jgi:hypothetical protein
VQLIVECPRVAEISDENALENEIERLANQLGNGTQAAQVHYELALLKLMRQTAKGSSSDLATLDEIMGHLETAERLDPTSFKYAAMRQTCIRHLAGVVVHSVSDLYMPSEEESQDQRLTDRLMEIATPVVERLLDSGPLTYQDRFLAAKHYAWLAGRGGRRYSSEELQEFKEKAVTLIREGLEQCQPHRPMLERNMELLRLSLFTAWGPGQEYDSETAEDIPFLPGMPRAEVQDLLDKWNDWLQGKEDT